MTDDRGQRTELVSWRTRAFGKEVRSRRSEVRGKRTDAFKFKVPSLDLRMNGFHRSRLTANRLPFTVYHLRLERIDQIALRLEPAPYAGINDKCEINGLWPVKLSAEYHLQCRSIFREL